MVPQRILSQWIRLGTDPSGLDDSCQSAFGSCHHLGEGVPKYQRSKPSAYRGFSRACSYALRGALCEEDSSVLLTLRRCLPHKLRRHAQMWTRSP